MVMVKEILKLVRITVQTTKKLSIGAARKQSVPNTNKQLYIQSYRSTFSNFFRISTTSLSEKFKQQSPRLYCMLSPEILYKFQMPRKIHNLSAEILTPKRVKKIPVLSVNCSFVGNSESFAPYHAPVNFRR